MIPAALGALLDAGDGLLLPPRPRGDGLGAGGVTRRRELRRYVAVRDAPLQLAVSVVKTTTLVIASRHAAYKTASIYFVAFALCPPGAEEQRELHYLWVIEAARVHTAFAPLRHAPR
ncbi:MAG: hypothetical protein IPN01_26350 [Deltaproteobacteria bacterium]|nr:hypothetical protein [Deltaproteobacteria bacterium]